MLKGSRQLAELAYGAVGPQQDLKQGPKLSDIKIKSVRNQFVVSQLTSYLTMKPRLCFNIYKKVCCSY